MAKMQARIRVTIRPDPKPDTPSYYVNHASVSHSEYDFIMSVLRVPEQLTLDQAELAKAGQPIPVEPILQIIFPPRLIDGLIKALIIQKDNYEQENGPIRADKREAE